MRDGAEVLGWGEKVIVQRAVPATFWLTERALWLTGFPAELGAPFPKAFQPEFLVSGRA